LCQTNPCRFEPFKSEDHPATALHRTVPGDTLRMIAISPDASHLK
jgi:hypothetical protein